MKRTHDHIFDLCEEEERHSPTPPQVQGHVQGHVQVVELEESPPPRGATGPGPLPGQRQGQRQRQGQGPPGAGAGAGAGTGAGTQHRVAPMAPMASVAPVTPMVGKRVRRKFCSSCVDYFCAHFNHNFAQPLHPEFVRLRVLEYLENPPPHPNSMPVDYASADEVKRVASICLQLIQDSQSKKSSESHGHGHGHGPEVYSVDDDVDFDDVTFNSHQNSYVNNSAEGIMYDVLKIYPDANPTFVTALLDTHSMATDLSSSPLIGGPKVRYCPDAFVKIVTEMAEKGYDKVTQKPEATSSSSLGNNSGSSKSGSGVGRHTYSRDFTSSSWETEARYRLQAMQLLQNDFPFFKVHPMQQFFANECKHHYYLAVQALEALLGFPRQHRYPLRAETIEQRKQDLLKCSSALTKAKLKIKHGWKMSPFLFDVGLGGEKIDEVLEEECHFLRTQEAAQQEARDHEVAERLNEEIAENEGSLLECGCCCGEYAFEALIQCSEGHLFCRTCLKSYIENTLFGSGKTRLACMSSAAGEPCPGMYSEQFVKNALPPLVYQKFQDAIAQEAVKAANIEGLLQCHACGYQVELSSDAGSVLKCPSCAKQTCRFCQEEAHIPLRCNEVEKKAVTNLRVNVEEAMSEARIRVCPNPKCKQRFYKTEGCNKMSCACGRKICYQCRKDITKVGYQHFCTTPHCKHKNCGMCLLFSDSITDDRQAMYEAGLKKMEAEKKALPPAGSSNTGGGSGSSGERHQASTEELGVNLDSLLEGGALQPKKKARTAAAPRRR